MTRPKPPSAALPSSADDVEAQFYEALQQGDLTRVMAVWADDEDVVCVHPGGARLVGSAAIRAGFEALFATGGVPVHCGEVHRVQGPGVAIHHLVERLPASGRGQAAGVVATNVYLHTAQGWRLVVHHASAAPVPAPALPGRPTTLH